MIGSCAWGPVQQPVPQQQHMFTIHCLSPFRFVLENSGVAEPQNIRDKFSEAIASGHPLMSRIQLDTMATIVDSGSFTADYSSRTPVSGRLTCQLLPVSIKGIEHKCFPLYAIFKSR